VSGLFAVEPVNRASGLAVAVTLPPTLAACQSPGVTVTPRHALALRETVRQQGIHFFVGRPVPRMPGHGGNFTPAMRV
jgi:hypothetical protein